MNVMMSEEQSNFIEGIKKYMLEASNMTESEAHNFAFVVYQHQEWLREFLTIDTAKKNINNMNCTGENCVMQYDKVDPKTCKCVSFCPYATPPIAVTQEDLDAVRKMIQILKEPPKDE